MFKSKKKHLEIDPPKAMSMKEIQEDLETFSKIIHNPNRNQVNKKILFLTKCLIISELVGRR